MTSSDATAATASVAAAPGHQRRPDIQGLRALAVLLVVGNHLFDRPAGGFVGVDVFFVISGYLITGVLVRQGETRGRPSIRDFYARRIRRVMPAAVVVLVATLLVSRQVFTATRAHQTQVDSVWALFFGANVHFSRLGTDYFAQNRPPSPVQHYWSLSVEEQFYVVWPLLILGAFLIARRLHRGHRGLVLGLAVAGTATSFAWCLHLTSVDQSGAYFSTAARAWELGLGAILAVGQGHASRLPNTVRAVAAWAGLGAIAASTFLFDATTTFPGAAAALPVVGVGLVLAANDPRFGPGQEGLLSNAITGFLGDISYSLYLWHFPCLVLAGGYFSTRNAGFYLVAGVLPFLLAVASFHLVEEPVRNSSWLDKKPAGYRRRTPADWLDTNKKTIDGLMAAAAVLVFASAAVVLRVPSLPDTGGQYAEAVATTATAAPAAPTTALATFGPATATSQVEIASALAATSFPQLRPTLDEVAAGSQAPADIERCSGLQSLGTPCSWGPADAPKKAMIVGDSTAMVYSTPLRAIFGARPDWRLTTLALAGCPFTRDRVDNKDSNIMRACPGHKQDTLAAIRAAKPDLLFVTNTYEASLDLAAHTDFPPLQYSASTKALLDSVRGDVKKIVVLAPPPVGADIATCYTPRSKPFACITHVNTRWSGMATAEQAMATALGGVFLDPRVFLCNAKDLCPSFIGPVPVKMDRGHLSPAFQLTLVPILPELLTHAGVVL